MININKRKLITALLILAVIFSFTACGERIISQKTEMAGDYAAIFNKLSETGRKYCSYTNDIEMILEDAEYYATSTEADTAAATSDSSEAYKDYSQTNTQVEGIDESDIVKTDGKYIYVSKGSQVKIIIADGENTKTVSTVNAVKDEAREYICGMYIIGNKLCVITTKYSFWAENGNEEEQTATYVSVYDLSDIEEPELLSQSKQDGWYQDSRMKDGVLYLVSYYTVYNEIEAQPETYIPSVCDVHNGERLIPADCIVIPEVVDSRDFVVISAVNTEDADIMSTYSMLGYGGTMYMSNNALYLVNTSYRQNTLREYTEDNYKVTEYADITESEIVSFSFEGVNITNVATGKVQGYPVNQFALDEKDGFLRIVVTDDYRTYKEYYDAKHEWSNHESGDESQTSALYVLDKNLTVVGKITGLAEDERVYSVRFMGDIGYFVTFKQVDPLFSVDLSDQYEPKIIGELKIPGFSTYLQSYSDGLLFGIGNDTVDYGEFITTGNMKLSMFDVSDPSNVTECSKLALEDTYSEALYNHHAILVNAEKNIIGFATNNEYLVYGYGDEGFYQRATIKLTAEEYSWASSRGIYIGDIFYVVNEERITVLDMSDFSFMAEINL